MTWPPDPQQPHNGPPPPYGQPQQPLPQPPSYGGGPQQPYGAPDPYGQPAYGQPAYGQPDYGQPAYGQPGFGQPGPGPGQPGPGQPGPGHPYGQPPKKSSGGKIALFVIGGVVALCLVFGVIGAVWYGMRDSDSDADTVTTAESAQSGSDGALNQPARDGNTEFTVKSAECGATSVGDEYSQKTPKGQFCLVTATVKNLGNEPLSLEAGTNEAYNAEGQEFKADISASIAANEDLTLFLSDVNPGTSTEVTWVWDIPQGQRITKVKLFESFSSNGVEIKVG
ncbi:DUF4352 domain-containing protein [Cryptosporangium minutisporangium]|uniref:DUF4352 domain-containing protein n=1 Tax=Cryptosporangium minutisporangium TaxID=113569 RepID=A0ABP6SZ81_9ACTN